MPRAMADFDQAIQLDSTTLRTIGNDARAYFKDNKTELAIADFNQALTLKPNWVLC